MLVLSGVAWDAAGCLVQALNEVHEVDIRCYIFPARRNVGGAVRLRHPDALESSAQLLLCHAEEHLLKRLGIA